jgi:hypothetical protein
MARTFGKAPSHMAFEHGARGQQPDQIARRGLQRNAMPVPCDIPGEIADPPAGRDDLVGPAREKRFDYAAPARQQAVRVVALRHAFARHIRERENVTLQQRDSLEIIRQRSGGQQATHAGADHNGMVSNPLHENAP